eukprot:TRINITY_DN8170_c0_g2_i4.p1 TRINITY_DN8170_c0_g2~~TRINITY_DN8170_c0_g2_i4.p1  ORF type:complete len:750 (-),score=243.54 TRINITY_DN8170_c0_g2_i4:172-2421(-)
MSKGTREEITTWGHEYLHHLAAEIGEEYNRRLIANANRDELTALVRQIVPNFMAHNSEHDAIDLLMEVDQLENLVEYVTDTNFQRVVLYLMSTSQYCADQDEWLKTLRIAYESSLKQKQYVYALVIAIKLDDVDRIRRVFDIATDPNVLKQLSFIAARQRINLELPEDLQKIASNSLLSEFFLLLQKDLDVLEPKAPDQVYKVQFEEKTKTGAQLDSLKQNLADTYVNAFVNLGSGRDTLMNVKEGQPWIHNLKNDAQVAGTGSLGLIHMWDIEEGSTSITDYLNLKDGFARMGACIAIGVTNTGVTNEFDTAKALLEEQLQGRDDYAKRGAVIGLGIAYAGSAREDLLEILTPLVIDPNLSVELSAFAALSIGLIFVGRCHEDAANSILQTLSERPENQLNMTISRYFSVGLSLLFLGQQDNCEAIIDALGIINHPIKKYTETLVEACAFVGSGNVLKVQKMLHQCLGNPEEKDAGYQAVAVLGVGLIAASEDVGSEMSLRMINHLLQYGNVTVKRAIPLALALLNLSNPKVTIMDHLSKLSHDSDAETSQRAIIALGLIGAGTNNSRLAGIFRQLAVYYAKDPSNLYLVRISQGLLHMGKGLVTIQPYYYDRFLYSKVSMAGIIIFANSCLDMTNIIIEKYHYMLFYLCLSIYPKSLFLLDESLKPLPVSVRVGQAVDVVGQAGQPKRITGFQTHNAPVLISYGERAEIATEEMIPITDVVLENFVIIKKNPNYSEDQDKPRKKTSL